ncbi:MAG: hypothetical protein AB8E15_01615 [Bdellovibrionales bacterium]
MNYDKKLILSMGILLAFLAYHGLKDHLEPVTAQTIENYDDFPQKLQNTGVEESNEDVSLMDSFTEGYKKRYGAINALNLDFETKEKVNFGDIEFNGKSLLKMDPNVIRFDELSDGESAQILRDFSDKILKYKTCKRCLHSNIEDGNFSALLDVALEISQFQAEQLYILDEALKFAITNDNFHTHGKTIAQLLLVSEPTLNTNMDFLLKHKLEMNMSARAEVYLQASKKAHMLSDELILKKEESLYEDILGKRTEISTTLLSQFDQYSENPELIAQIADELCSNPMNLSKKEVLKRYTHLQAAAFSNGTPVQFSNCL